MMRPKDRPLRAFALLGTLGLSVWPSCSPDAGTTTGTGGTGGHVSGNTGGSGFGSGGSTTSGSGGSGTLGSGGTTTGSGGNGTLGSGGTTTGSGGGTTTGTGGGATSTGGGGPGTGGGQASGGAGARSGSGGAVGTGGTGGTGGTVTGTAGSWYPQDLSFTSTANKANPYMDVTDFKVTFTGPQGVTLVVPGFYVGGQVWKVRFAPTVAGTFTYVTSSAQDASLNAQMGTVPAAMPNPNGHGEILVDPAHPHHYLFRDGTHRFQMGYELDWLALMDFGDPTVAKAKAIIDMVASNGFSEVIMNAFAYDTTWKTGHTSAFDFGPPAQYAWAGSNTTPDHTQMNEAYWQNYDRVVAYLFEKGVAAHVFFRVYNKMVNWPTKGSAEDDMYFKYVVARYQAYDNMLWDFSKEVYNEPDHTYIASRMNLMKANDAYHHLRTLHDPDGGQSQLGPNYYDEAAHAGTAEFYTDQSSNQYNTAKSAIAKRAMPYYNAEVTLYQVGNDGTFTYGPHSPKEDVFAASMEVLMAGGYFAYYYSLHAWDVVKFSEVPNGIGQYKNVSDFMKSTNWYTMSADDAAIGGGATGSHCLSNAGKEYIVYKNAGGSVTLNIAGTATALSAKWVNLATAAVSALPDQTPGSHMFMSPWNGPSVLYLLAH